ncbi:hypothetical protein Y032_0114g421 [Ancylostoma ceylanicum]|nr:hypothetical protein Y032_0114g421 [Ancylostoma ceylanicum]
MPDDSRNEHESILLSEPYVIPSRKGRQSRTNTTFRLVSAYSYSEYFVVTIEADKWYGKKAYCRYFDKNWVELEPSVESVGFPEYAYYCCKHPLAKHMSISETKNETVNFTVPVIDRKIDDPKYNLSMCVAPLYGDFERKWLLLAELIEHYKLQGVQHFYIYIKDIDSYSLKLVYDYVKTGEAEVVYFREERDRTGNEWQQVEIQDCALRSLHHSRYSIFADLDDRITALKSPTLIEYISKTLTEQTNFALLCFGVKYVLRMRKTPEKYEGEQTLLEYLPTLAFRNTTSAAPTGAATKCVADTRRVMAMGIHNAYIFMPGYDTFFVPSDIAVNIHYREPYGDGWYNRRIALVSRYGPFKIEGYPTHLIDPLYRNVKRRLDRVYGVNSL